jgi:hypothetical protein
MPKKILPVLVISCLTSLPALAEENKIIDFDGLGEGGYALINPGTYATEASGLITLIPGTGASDNGIVTFHVALANGRAGNEAPPNCTFSPARQFETTAQWPFPSQFSQYGKDCHWKRHRRMADGSTVSDRTEIPDRPRLRTQGEKSASSVVSALPP